MKNVLPSDNPVLRLAAAFGLTRRLAVPCIFLAFLIVPNKIAF